MSKKLKKIFISSFKYIFKYILNFHIHYDFVILFINKEGKELLGKRYKNFIFLILILLLTFISISISNGSLNYLDKKMNDPFVNFINIKIPYGLSSQIGTIQYKLNHDSILKQKYNCDNAQGHNRLFLNFLCKNKKKCFQIEGRTIGINDPILKKIFKEYHIEGRTFKDNMDIGLIVTEKFIKNYNYSKKTSHALLSLPIDPENNIDTIVPIPIIAIVKALPGLNEFAVSHFFYTQKRLSYGGNPFNPMHTKKIKFFVDCDSTNAYNFKNKIITIFKNTKYKKYYPEVDIYKNNESFITGYNIQISLFRADSKVLQTISNNLKTNNELKKYHFIQIYDYNFNTNEDYKGYDILSINFNNLDNIQNFKEYIYKKYKLEIDMAQIEKMENYNFITKLTRILSIALIFFSVLSICMLVSNILSSHLEKIRMNIGTFKAFGINNQTLQKIYIIIISLFISVSIIISIFLSWLFGLINGFRLLLSLFVNKLEPDETYYNLFDVWTLISILTIIVFSFIVSYISANKILIKTPGDLIYRR